jgi:hypothetical protein
MGVGDMLVAGQGMADQDRVAAVLVERPVGLVGDLQEVDAMAGIEDERLVRPETGDRARRVVGLIEGMVRPVRRRTLRRNRFVGYRHGRSRASRLRLS